MRMAFWRAKYTDVEALAAAWANIDTKSLVNLLENGDFEVGDPPVGWAAAAATLASESTIIKIGSKALKMTCNGAWGEARQQIANFERYKSRKVTIGAWCRAASGNDKNQILAIYDGVGTSVGIVIPKDDTYRWTTLTRTIDSGATEFQVIFYINYSSTPDTDDIFYASGAILVEGDSCPAFSPKPDQALICHHTAAYTISPYETGHVVHTNLGAGDAVTLTLPQTVGAGFVCHFAVMAAQELRIDPGAAGAIYINGAKQTDDKYIWADDEAESVDLVADGNGDWVARNMVGTWEVEA